MNLKKSTIWLFFFSCILILLTLPRFNRNDVGMKSITAGGTGELGDAIQYVNITLYFRGEKTIDDLKPPFIYRSLIPFLASLLPFDAMTSINIINLAAMIIALIFIYEIMTWLNIDFVPKIFGCCLFVFSFPTFYYTSIGYIDPVLICLLTVGLYAIFTNRLFILAFTIIIGAFVKETIIILIITLTVYSIYTHTIFTKKFLVIFLMIFLFIIAYFISRNIIPCNSKYFWFPSFDTLIYNIGRPRSWISFLLSFGIQGFLTLLFFRYKATILTQFRLEEIATLIISLFISILLFVYSMFSAYADGRFIWTSYAFTTPIAAIVFGELKKYRMAKIYSKLHIHFGKTI